MARWIKQSTATTVVIGPFVDSTDGVTAETALTIAQADIRLSKNGAAFAQTNNVAGATHMENGNYSVPLDATDSNTLGVLRLHVNETGALPVWEDFLVVPANVWDSLFGADALQVHAVEMSANLITSTVIATDAITDAKVAPDVTIASVTGAVGSVTGNVGGNVVGSVGSVTATVNANTIQISGDATAADNLELAFDDTAGAVPWLGVFEQGTAQSATATTVVLRAAAAFADSTLVGCTIWVYGSTQGYWQPRVITANVSATDTVTVDAWTVTPSGTITYKIVGTAPASTSSPAAVNVVQISGDATAADNAEAFFDGTGYAGTNNVIPSVTTVTGNVGGNVVGSVASVAAAVTVGTNNDKTGYALSAAGIQAIWDALTSALTTVGSIGKLLVDNINATISSRSSHSAADVWASATRTLTAGTNIALAKGTGVTGFNDLSAADVTAAVPTAIQNADALLDRNMATGTDSGTEVIRTVRQALRALRNRVAVVGNLMTVRKEDDATASWTATVTTTAGNPISEINPTDA